MSKQEKSKYDSGETTYNEEKFPKSVSRDEEKIKKIKLLQEKINNENNIIEAYDVQLENLRNNKNVGQSQSPFKKKSIFERLSSNKTNKLKKPKKKRKKEEDYEDKIPEPKIFEKAKNADDSPHILYALGLSNLRDKQYDKANEMFDLCLQKNLQTPEVYHAKGQALYGKGEYDEAFNYLNSAVNSKPEYYVAWNSLANCYDKMGKKQEALSWYKYAAETEPKNSLYMINYCISLLENGYVDQCKEILKFVESFYPTQKDMFNEQENNFIEKSIKDVHDKLEGNKSGNVVKLEQPSEQLLIQENQGY